MKCGKGARYVIAGGGGRATADNDSIQFGPLILRTMHAQESARSSHSALDIQLAVLRQLPTPVLVLSPSRKAVFANRAAERVIGSLDPVPTGTGILGQGPVELGIQLLYNRKWNVVLERLMVAQKEAYAEERDRPVHELDAVVSNATLTYDGRHLRILASILAVDGGNHFLLSFERSAHIEKKSIPHHEDHILTRMEALSHRMDCSMRPPLLKDEISIASRRRSSTAATSQHSY